MKDEQLLRSLIKQGESEQLEFKEVVRKEEIAKTLCAFLNTNGGTVIIGIQDDGKIIGIKDFNNIETELKKYLFKSIIPEAPITVSTVFFDDKNIIILEVWNGSKPPYVFEGYIYFRKGDQTIKATPDNISQLIVQRQKTELHWERQSALGTETDDFDLKLIQKLIKESQKNTRGSFKGNDVLDFLTHYGLYQNGAFTNACVVLFAKNPARFLPQIRVRLTEYAKGKTDNSLLRDEVYEGNLFETRDKLERYINGLGIRSVFDQNQMKRIDFKYPVKALQEGLINALMHRDYSSVSSGVAISVYPDRFVITNSGHFPDGLSIKDIKKEHHAHPVNPDIAHMVFLLGLIDKLGKGIEKLTEECRNANLKDPVWKDAPDGVTLTFYGPKALPVKKDNTRNDAVNDTANDPMNDAVNDTISNSTSYIVKARLVKIINLISINPGCKLSDLLKEINISTRVLKENISSLIEANLIEYSGSKKTGGYYITNELKSKQNTINKTL